MMTDLARKLTRRIKDSALDLLFGLLMRSPSRRRHRAPFGAEELRLVYKALRSQHLGGTGGKMVAAFEQAFAALYGVPYAVASTSGTSAVHVALGALDLNPGDEVITAPITDMGSIIPILYQNAIPVFADVDETYNMSSQAIERKITPRTRAILLVHLFGNPCDMDAILAIARQHGLAVIEDCSQAHLTRYNGRYVGTIGDMGCFSFQQSKPMTTGEGGMTITWDKAQYERMKLFVDKGFARKGWGPRSYLMHAPNYRPTELTAAVGLGQLGKVQRAIAKRSALGRRMSERLAGVDGVVPAPVTPGGEHTFWLYPLRLVGPDRQGVAAALKDAGIPAIPGYTGKPIYLCSEPLRTKRIYGRSSWPFAFGDSGGTYEYDEGLCPHAEQLLDQLLCIPWDESWTMRDVDRVADVVRGAVAAPVGTQTAAAATVRPIASPGPAPAVDTKRLRVAIVGCGRIGRWHLNAYRRHAQADVVAVTDVEYDRAEAFAREIGATPYRAHQEMLRTEVLNGASICTVPSTHLEIAQDLLDAGVHVLCEKPLAVTTTQARQMLEKARAANRLLLPAFKFRFHEEVNTAKELLATGSFGRILTFRMMFGGWLDMAGTWYVMPELSGGGVLMDNGPHAIDLIHYLLGEIDGVQVEVTDGHSYGVEDTANLTVRMKDGSVGTAQLSWSLSVPSRTYLEVYGEQGTIQVDLEGVTYKFKTWADWKRIRNRSTMEDAFARQIGHFLDAIRVGSPSTLTGEDGLRTQAVIEAAYASLERRMGLPELSQVYGG